MRIKTMRGHDIDMSRFIARNESAVAIGNASMNARGDVVGPGGSIIKTREQVAQEYHRSNPKAVRQVGLKDLTDEVFSSPADALAALSPPAATPADAKPSSKKKIADSDS